MSSDGPVSNDGPERVSARMRERLSARVHAQAHRQHFLLCNAWAAGLLENGMVGARLSWAVTMLVLFAAGRAALSEYVADDGFNRFVQSLSACKAGAQGGGGRLVCITAEVMHRFADWNLAFATLCQCPSDLSCRFEHSLLLS